MTKLKEKSALVIGASSGVGLSTVKALILEGARVTAVARGIDRLSTLKTELGNGIVTSSGDAADSAFVERLLLDLQPDLVVLSAGVTPQMDPVDEFDWQSFSEAWNGDLKASFLLLKHSLSVPLRRGSTVVLVSSGAAMSSSQHVGHPVVVNLQKD